MNIVEPTAQSIAAAARLLRDGGLVAFPTETVYGLGGDATNERAVAAIFEAKGRPQFNPLISHVLDDAYLEHAGETGAVGVVALIGMLFAALVMAVRFKRRATTLEDALDKAVHSLQDDFPVIRGSDMVGVISKRKILEALRVEGNGYVQAVMNRIFEVAQKGESLASAFRKLTARNLSIIPVVEDQRLVGIVTLQNLMHSMALLAESRKLRKQALNS